jgi:isoleucyl-tRNA synthetase
MSKSQGTGISPNEIVKASGADVLRLWVASSDYHEDVRCSEEILQRTVEAYRKIRNTARFALGNIHGFNAVTDSVTEDNLEEIDRWVLAELAITTKAVLEGYRDYEFAYAYRSLYFFCTVTLSARYFDIAKDRLYTFAPRNPKRRAAQTVLYQITNSLARMLAPIVPFTADEIWENLSEASGDERHPSSVHLAQFPEASDKDYGDLRRDWNGHLFELRDHVLNKLEEARSSKLIGSSLEASLHFKVGKFWFDLLSPRLDFLRYVFIVSNVNLELGGERENSLSIEVVRADGEKCERCWNYSTRVGESEKYPGVCERCVAALAEIESELASTR